MVKRSHRQGVERPKKAAVLHLGTQEALDALQALKEDLSEKTAPASNSRRKDHHAALTTLISTEEQKRILMNRNQNTRALPVLSAEPGPSLKIHLPGRKAERSALKIRN